MEGVVDDDDDDDDDDGDGDDDVDCGDDDDVDQDLFVPCELFHEIFEKQVAVFHQKAPNNLVWLFLDYPNQDGGDK